MPWYQITYTTTAQTEAVALVRADSNKEAVNRLRREKDGQEIGPFECTELQDDPGEIAGQSLFDHVERLRRRFTISRYEEVMK